MFTLEQAKALPRLRRINAAERKLVAALRSGRFKQTSGFLRKKRGKKLSYCCLGVACAISGLGKFNPKHVHGNFLGNNQVLPNEVKQQLGWSGNSGTLSKEVGDVYDLAELNDSSNASLQTIAEVIDKGYVKKAS